MFAASSRCCTSVAWCSRISGGSTNTISHGLTDITIAASAPRDRVAVSSATSRQPPSTVARSVCDSDTAYTPATSELFTVV